MEIQWYPGHMAKSKKLLQENIKLVDVVLEILDARIPLSSANPDLDKLITKPKIIILNKEDLADPIQTKNWIDYFNQKGVKALSFNAKSQKGREQVIKDIVSFTKSKMTGKKALLARAPRAMVVGIPNVGKSTFINTLVRKKLAKTGDKPGVTRGKQWIRILSDLEMLDTPGLLWPKFDSREVAFNLAVVGAISDQVYNLEEVAVKLLERLKTDYPRLLHAKYEFLDLNKQAPELLEEFGRKRGFLLPGGIVDLEKAAMALLNDFRHGKLGRITLEKPFE